MIGHTQELKFESEATLLAARLYRPKVSDPAPVIVMAHGFSAVMEQLAPQAKIVAGGGLCRAGV
ncbi:MAG: hypothetical protein IPF48_10895 [Sphingomonadales bacterium]|nr:hypothetical protein [Sphingomonadales bacterium]